MAGSNSGLLLLGLGVGACMCITVALLVFVGRGKAPAPTSPPAPSSRRQQPQTVPSSGGVKTTASYHYDFSTNACALRPDPSGNNTAMSPTLASALGYPKPGPGSSICGKKLHVTNLDSGKSVVVTVLDLRGDEKGLDMEDDAFKRIDNGAGVQAGQHSNLQVRWV